MRAQQRKEIESMTIIIIKNGIIYLIPAEGLPEVIAVKIIRVGVVVVVRKLPAAIREHEGAHADGADDLVDQTALVEALVRAVVANDKEAGGSGAEEDPGEREEVPGRLDRHVQSDQDGDPDARHRHKRKHRALLKCVLGHLGDHISKSVRVGRLERGRLLRGRAAGE